MGETSWLFLLVGSFAALGAAMAVGTLVALLRHRRTGTFPGSDEPVALTGRRMISLWARIALGTIVAVVGVVAIERAGLF